MAATVKWLDETEWFAVYDLRARKEISELLDAFAARAVAAEREACALMCEQLEIANPFTLPMKEKLRIFDALNQAAAAIRARGGCPSTNTGEHIWETVDKFGEARERPWCRMCGAEEDSPDK